MRDVRRLYQGLAAGVAVGRSVAQRRWLTPPTPRCKLKAVYTGRFASYVRWPQQEASAFDITVLGAHPLGEQLAALYADKRIQGKPVHIRTVARIEDIGTPEVLSWPCRPWQPARRPSLMRNATAS